MGRTLISKSRQDFLRLILKDERITSKFLLNGEIPESLVIHDDGSVTFGRTPRKWWNWLFRDQTHLEFDTLCLRILVSYVDYTPKAANFEQFMLPEIINKAIYSKDYDSIIDTFVMHALIGVSEGPYRLKALNIAQPPERNNKKESRVDYSDTSYLNFNIGGGQLRIPMVIETKR